MLPAKDLSKILCHARGLTRTPPALNFHVRNSHTVKAKSSYIVASSEKDPYEYQVGFGNRFVSEALCVVLRRGHRAPLGLTQKAYDAGLGHSQWRKIPHKGLSMGYTLRR
jgi:hypothetical protein